MLQHTFKHAHAIPSCGAGVFSGDSIICDRCCAENIVGYGAQCCRVVSGHARSKLELPTQQLMDLILSDTMFQEAMQVNSTHDDLMFAC